MLVVHQCYCCFYNLHQFSPSNSLTNINVTLNWRRLRRSAAHAEASWSPTDALLLWGGALWDPRIPQPIHRFDMLSDAGAGVFHPFGNEAVINSEVRASRGGPEGV